MLLLLLLAYACGFFAGLNSMCVLLLASPLPCLLCALSPSGGGGGDPAWWRGGEEAQGTAQRGRSRLLQVLTRLLQAWDGRGPYR